MQLIKAIVLICKHAIFQRLNLDVHSFLSLLEAKPKNVNRLKCVTAERNNVTGVSFVCFFLFAFIVFCVCVL